jgi:uncharacterized membrane protein YeaQ/YmgE (transglycosylase-associated protein family)
MISDAMAWAAIGAAASLAGMMHPFHRGLAGVLFNLLAGVLGAIAAGLISALAMPDYLPHARPWHLFFAAVGAIVALAATHLYSVRLRPSKAG